MTGLFPSNSLWNQSVPNMTNMTDPFVGYPLTPGVHIAALVVGFVVFISGILGNILIVTTLLSQKSLHSVHNIFIANLAAADLLVTGYVMPFWLLDLLIGRQPVASNVHCIVNAFFTHGAFYTSVFTIVTIAVHRYLFVCRHRLFVKVFTRKRTVSCCFVLWLLGFCVCLPYAVMLQKDTVGYEPTAHLCVFHKHEFGTYTSVSAAILLFLPMPIIGACNAAIFRLWKRSRARLGQWKQTAKPVSCTSRAAVGHDHGVRHASCPLEERPASGKPDKTRQATSAAVPSDPEVADKSIGDAELKCQSEQLIAGEEKNLTITRNQINDYVVGMPSKGDDSHTPARQELPNTTNASTFCTENETDAGKGRATRPFWRHPCTTTIIRAFEKVKVLGQEAGADWTASRSCKNCAETLSASDIALLRSLVIIFACCVLTYLPMCFTLILNLYRDLPSDVISSVVFGLFFNHSINWIVYGFLNKNFSEGYKRQFQACCRQCNNISRKSREGFVL